jgi:Uma2 family endonuclease
MQKGTSPMVLQRDHWISLEEYHEIERTSEIKYEYIDGRIYAMSGGTFENDQIAINLIVALRAHLRGKVCRVASSDMKVLPLGDENPSYYPDVTVTCNPEDYKRGSTTVRSPRLIVEVLSRSTEYKDRRRKMRDYQACPSVEEYVIVSTRYQAVEILHRQGTFWEHKQFLPGEDVELVTVGLKIPISSIYEDTDIPEQEEI